MDKSLKIIKIILLLIIVFILIGVLVFFSARGFIGNSSGWPGKAQSPSQIYTFNQSDIKSADIDWKLGKVSISSTNDKTITINQINYGNDSETHVSAEVSNDKLIVKTINHNARFNFFGLGHKQCDLEIFLPERKYEDFHLTASLGDVNISDTKTSDFKINADMGRVAMDNIKADDIEIDADMGEVVLTEVEAVSLDCKASMGELIIENSNFVDSFSAKVDMGELRSKLTNAPKKMELKVSMGNLVLKIPENSGFTIKTNVSLGDFDCEFTNIGNNGTFTYKDGSRTYDVDVSMGDLTIKKVA